MAFIDKWRSYQDKNDNSGIMFLRFIVQCIQVPVYLDLVIIMYKHTSRKKITVIFDIISDNAN